MKSPRIRHIIWLLLLWLMPGSFVVMGQNVNEKSAQEAENVQDAICLLTEHPQAQINQNQYGMEKVEKLGAAGINMLY